MESYWHLHGGMISTVDCLPYFCANKRPNSLRYAATTLIVPRHQTTIQKREVSSFGETQRNIENHLSYELMEWALLNAILSSALRHKSMVLPNKPLIKAQLLANPTTILSCLSSSQCSEPVHDIPLIHFLGILLIAHEIITIIYLGIFSPRHLGAKAQMRQGC